MQNSIKLQHLLFVINPIAGDIDKEELEEEIKTVCQEHGLQCELYKTTGENDKEQTAKMLS